MSATLAPAVAPRADARGARERVAAERGRLRLLALFAAVGGAVTVAALLLAAGALALGHGRWIAAPRAVPFAVWAVVAAAVAAVALGARRRLARGLATSEVARAIEREQGLRDGSLRAVLEVAGTGALARHAEARLLARLGGSGAALAPARRRGAMHAAAVGLAGGVLALVALAASAATSADGWAAIAHPVRAWNGTLLPPIAIVNAPPGVMRGEALTLAVRAPGRREITMRYRLTGGAWRALRLPVTDDHAALALPAVDANLTAVASDGRASSDTALVRVTDRPFLGDVSIQATFPAYLGRAPETLPLGEPARVPRGTELRIEGGSSTLLRTVALAAGADTLRFAVDGRHFAGRLVAERSGRWTWSAAGVKGAVPDVPAPLDLDVLPDAPPTMAIVAPARDTLVLPDARVALALEAT
ncbi:MAG TPA: hypothetical protein VF048_03850, partial [Gemmatimonadaceae bacterium]